MMNSSTLLNFLENAHFPNPPIQIRGNAATTDVSLTDMGLVDENWKARRAIRDNALVDNLCDTLQQILGQTPIPQNDDFLRGAFSPALERDRIWRAVNASDADSTTLLDLGVNIALLRCAEIYDPSLDILCRGQRRSGESLSRVDQAVFEGAVARILLEAKSPTVMAAVGGSLPLNGVHLRWQQGGRLLSKVFLKAAVYLGLRKREWLFLTCHNSWIVFRLTKVDGITFLAYSPVLEMKNSSRPFRAYLCALLSVIKDVPVQTTNFPADIDLDILDEEPDEDDPPSECDSGSEYPPSRSGMTDSGTTDRNSAPVTRSAGGGDRASELMLTSSAVDSPDPHWAHLSGISADYSVIPLLSHEWDGRVRISRLLGAGSTGGVYEGSLGEKLLAIKVVEILRPADIPKRRRLRSEFDIYIYLERAFRNKKLAQRVAPQPYGVFGSKRMDALILDLHEAAPCDWFDFTLSECEQVFALVKRLHSAGVVHGDLEPRNIVRTANGGFLLVDFTESAIHNCPDNDQLHALELLGRSSKRVRCSEIRSIRTELRRRQRSQ